jgi:hypothetical protein
MLLLITVSISAKTILINYSKLRFFMKTLGFLSLIILGMMLMSFTSTQSSADIQNGVAIHDESDPVKDYLPSFPVVVYENILFGKDELEDVEVDGDACFSQSGGCQASCNGDCACVCSGSGCACAPRNANIAGLNNGTLNDIKFIVTRQSLHVLAQSAAFFKTYKTIATNDIYMYMYRIAVALNANDEQSYASLVFKCNELIQQLPDDVRNDYNAYSLKNGLGIQI